MSQPTLELIPLRPAVRSDAPTTIDVLLKITAPDTELNAPRPRINLGLVIDRSGSMASAKKLDYARDAAAFAVQQLLPSDRVSVTVFDDTVQTLVPNAPAENKAAIVNAIRQVQPGGSTALHAGWTEGARQVRSNRIDGGLNRVILLSDGIANMGETSPDAIATDVNRLARESVGTTTMGLGDEYNEDLLEAMARSGDGSYYYIENAHQLPDIFQTELHGLMATFGTAVQLGFEPQNGVTVADVLNDLDGTPDGRFKLPNLVSGMPVLVVVRLNVPPIRREAELCRFTVTWTAPNEASQQQATVTLSLPCIVGSLWESLAANVEVEERATLLLLARFKKQATLCLERGDKVGAARWLADGEALLAAAPATPEIQREIEALNQIEAMLASGDESKFSKRAKFQAHSRRQSRT